MQHPVVGRIKQVLLKAITQSRELRLYFLITLFFAVRQCHAGKTEITQGVIDQFLLCLVKRVKGIAFPHGLILLIDILILRQAGSIIRDDRQAVAITFPEFLIINDRIQVRNSIPHF